MKSYSASCEHGHEFDGWYHSHAVFEHLIKTRKLECPQCGSVRVHKMPARPYVSGADTHAHNQEHKQLRRLRREIKAMNQKVRNTCEYVGDAFAEEVRSMKTETDKSRPIYGHATTEEIRELNRESVICHPIPWIEERQEH